jgi:hypothetical protein
MQSSEKQTLKSSNTICFASSDREKQIIEVFFYIFVDLCILKIFLDM